MGLMDILNGMQNGPRGAPQPSSGGSGGMSKTTMALLALLAYKALKSGGVLGGTTPAAAPGGTTAGGLPGGLGDILGGALGGGRPAGGAGTSGSGGLGDILGGMLGGGTQGGRSPSGGLSDILGGLVASGAAGSVLSGGLGNLMKELQSSGHGEAAQSWVGTGSNQSISPDDLAHALGADSINALTQHTGLSREELLQGLSQQLPEFVDKLTPDGRLPTEQEAARLI